MIQRIEKKHCRGFLFLILLKELQQVCTLCREQHTILQEVLVSVSAYHSLTNVDILFMVLLPS